MRISFASVWQVVLAVCIAVVPGCGSGSGADGVLRIGYQKWSTYSILKTSGELERAFAARGLRIEWVEFPAGPPLLEALNAGSIDLGHAGDSPPLFAQAAGVPFVYIAASSPSPESAAVLVREGSPLRAVSDLRGKRIGFTKGTSAHTLLLRVLEKHGLAFTDVEPVYLAPSDGRAALEAGAVDAWAIWDPYAAAAEYGGGVRRLVGGTGYVSGREYYFASSTAATERPEVIRAFLDELAGVKAWAKQRPAEVSGLLAGQTGLDPRAVALAEARRDRYDTGPVTADLVADQQALADRYFEIGLLPHRIEVRAAVGAVPFGRAD
ncbi:aliphatic sulfonate ABC transporter substrate-binding protein [Fimbriiglobus ruber]|uniref:Putative aliphatic sulfonates-binding protein n=1 Tax=Fimbriiglobus ruber TaxID=1908690 RepID=A0A225DC12_9BACT|nr:aliphatic sulfonate ABC transporter substrate-binding protein [Fimbriiglobus ruber]OWK39081.1 Alkanesulfonates-binding protein [Fimbriiglobus ruber]